MEIMEEYSNYEQFCPRCRRHGAPTKMEIYPPGTVEIGKNIQETIYLYPCGTVFNGTKGTFDEIKCEFKHITPEEALHEAEIVSRVMLHPMLEPTGEHEAWHGIRILPSNTKFLLWNGDILMSVLDKAETFLGTTLEYTESMQQIWIVDPALVSRGDMVIGTQFLADRTMLGIVQLLQPLKGWPEEKPYTCWPKPYRWGDTINTYEQAQAAAVYTWLQQPYVTQTEAIHHSRQVRREAERKNRKLNNISVIEFRRPEGQRSSKATEEEGSKRELHCCYERAGFTRRQPYGPKNALRRVQWIAPTFVGDPSKPFKTKSQKLYKVTR